MPAGKTPKNLNKSFAKEKKALVSKELAVERKRRKEVTKKLLPAPEGSKLALSMLSLSDKQELVMQWTINGGSLNGKRYSRHLLKIELGLSDAKLDELLVKCEKHYLRIYEISGELQKLVSKAITKTFMQLEEDRGRLITHTDIIDRERQACLDEIESAKASDPKTAKEKRERYAKISRFWSIYVALTEQQTLALGQLNQHSQASIKFIEVFQKQHGPTPPGKPPDEKEQPVTEAMLWAMLDEKSPQILPSQKSIESRKGSRDPDEAFQELKQDPELCLNSKKS